MVSIIIPVYNTREFLGQCFMSIASQKYTNYEVICVDDCSDDGSLEIIEKQCRLDNRFKCILKNEHSNAGDARNIGLKHAKGDYCLFLDSDDYLVSGALGGIVEEAEKTKADIVVFRYKLFYNDLERESKLLYGIHTNRKKVFNLRTVNSNKFEVTNIAIWNKLYRRCFINKHGLYYKSYSSINDVYFSWCALMEAERIVLCRTVGVCYRVNRKGSITSNLARNCKNFIEAFDDVVQYAEQRGLWREYGADLISAITAQVNEFSERIHSVDELIKEAEVFDNKVNIFLDKWRK